MGTEPKKEVMVEKNEIKKIIIRSLLVLTLEVGKAILDRLEDK